jgi:hypothetical protein
MGRIASELCTQHHMDVPFYLVYPRSSAIYSMPSKQRSVNVTASSNFHRFINVSQEHLI